MNPQIHGHCDPAFTPVRDVFAEHFARGKELGAAIAVYAGDRLIVDLWGGIADRRTGRSWRSDTPCLAFSCTKAVTATAALLLAERGEYDVDAPVAGWWPEFATAGKEEATAAHLLSHQVGLPALGRPVHPSEAHDPAAMADVLAAQRPLWRPGEAHGYHAITFGWLAGEIVRRLSGHSVGEFVRREIAAPRDLDLHIGGTPEVIERAARLSANRRPAAAETSGPAPAPPPPAPSGSAGTATTAGTPPTDPLSRLVADMSDPRSLLSQGLNNPLIADLPGGNNHPSMLAAGWPAMGMLTTARALAGFYRDLLAGRILRPETLRAAVERRVNGPDRVMHIDSSFGLGFMRPALVFLTPAAGAQTAFGHSGFGGSAGLADPAAGIAVAYLPNLLGDEVGGSLRLLRPLEAVYGCVS